MKKTKPSAVWEEMRQEIAVRRSEQEILPEESGVRPAEQPQPEEDLSAQAAPVVRPRIVPEEINYIPDPPADETEEKALPSAKPETAEAEAEAGEDAENTVILPAGTIRRVSPNPSAEEPEAPEAEAEAEAEAETAEPAPEAEAPSPEPAPVTMTMPEEDEDEDMKPLAAREDVYVSEDKHHVLLEILDWVKYILIAAIIGLSLNHFVIQRSEVEGNSMVPTLENHDQLLVEKVSVHFGLPPRGTIVTVDASKLEIRKEQELYVKRVIGLPGDEINFSGGSVFVNGVKLDEPYLPKGTVTNAPANWKGPFVVPAGHVYVLGDNRALSADSRLYGPVPLDALNGRVLVRIYPFAKFGLLP